MKKYIKLTSLILSICILVTSFDIFAAESNDSDVIIEREETINTNEIRRMEFEDSQLVEYTGDLFSYNRNDSGVAPINDDENDTAATKPEIGLPAHSSSNLGVTSIGNNTETEDIPMTVAAVSSSNYESVTSPSNNNGVNHPHLTGRNSSEYVSPFDGSLQVNYVDFHLPGRNGLDLNIGRFYKTEHSNVEVNHSSDNGYQVNPTTYYNKRFALGVGWSFSFPSVELRKKYDGTYQAFYHDGAGNAYRSNYNDSTKDENGEEYYNGNLIYCTNLDNYYTDNVRFKERDRSYTRDGVQSYYSFKTADNTMQYFGEQGEILAIKDRFNNEIKFDYGYYPGENIIPFYSYGMYSLGSYWSYDSAQLKYKSTSGKKTSTATTQRVDMDDWADEYYYSFLYQAEDNINGTFDGRIELYCDLYHDSTSLTSILLAEETPTVYNSVCKIEGELDLNDYLLELDDTPNRVRLRIKLVSAEDTIYITDIRFSPKIPLISKITDTVGRTVDFEYQGDVYTRYEENADYPIEITILDPEGNYINDLTYYRNYLYHTQNDDMDTFCEHRFFLFWGCWNGDYSTWVDYDWLDGKGSTYYANEHITNSYEFTGRPVLNLLENKNSNTYFTYEKVRKWTDNRSRGSTASATKYNTGFIDTWRVVEKYSVNAALDDAVENPEYNAYTYNYTSGKYTDETGYNIMSRLPEGPGYIDPVLGSYIVKVTNPNGRVDSYEYTSHIFDEGLRLKWEMCLPLLDKQTISESSSDTSDKIVREYTYTDNYALTSPTAIKTSETIGGTQRIYYTKTEYDTNSCLPVLTTLPLTEAEAALDETPIEKTIKTTYKSLSNRMFIPEKTEYYQEIDGEKLSALYSIDSMGRISSETKPNGDITYYEYSTKYPWLVSRVYFNDPDNSGSTDRVSEILYLYDDNYGFGPTQEKTKYADDSYAINAYEYESQFGQVSKATDANGVVTEFTYDDLGRLYIKYYPSFNSESGNKWICEQYYYYNYTDYGNEEVSEIYKRIYKTNSFGTSSGTLMESEESYYDDYGNLLYVKDKFGEQKYDYDTALRVAAYQNQVDHGSENYTISYTYDGFDRVTSASDRMGNKQNVNYAGLSNTYTFTPAGSTIAENHYRENFDIYGNKISEQIFPGGINASPLTTSYEYDLAGNVTKLTDANGRITLTEYDSINQPVSITRADGTKVDREYTKWGSVKTTTTYDGEDSYNISQTYDDRGLATSHRQTGLDIDTRPWYYSYNSIGNMSQHTEPNGNTVNYTYDDQSNLIGSSVANISDSMQYNYLGQLDKIQRTKDGVSVAVVDYTYDDKGLLTSKSVDSDTTSYTYDTLGAVASVTSGGNLTRNYTRDTLQRLTKVTADNKEFTYEYYADGLIKKLTYPGSAITVEYTYDNANRLSTMVTKKGSTTLKSYAYTYDNVGNIISVSGSDNVSYTYDDLYRLTSETSNGVTTTYEYDDRNNLISESRPGYSKTYTYSGDNRLSSVTENEVTTEYEYDLNGNLISRGDDEFAYDAENHLVYANVDDVVTTYEIGLDGLRKSKTTDGVTTTYEADESGNVLRENGDELIIGHDILAKKTDSGYQYYIYNAHGDVVLLVDENGNTLNSYSYDAWGNITSEAETVDNSIEYSGEYYDDETGFIYLRNRYYDPNTKRFTQEDPIRDELNWYAYCGNNPVMFVDPSGLDSVIFVSEGMESQAYVRQAYYKDLYNTLTYIVVIKSAEHFVEKWNEIFGEFKTIAIDAVEIICHGSITGDVEKDESGTAKSTGYLYFKDKSSRFYARNENGLLDNNDEFIAQLNPISVKRMYIPACNSANPDTYNIVYAFMGKVTYSDYIAGFDGGSVWDNELKDHKRGGGDSTSDLPLYALGDKLFYVKMYQKTWYKYVQKDDGDPTRERVGLRVFR